jgi:hypothetical protein
LRRVRASTRIELGNWRTRIGRSKEGGTDVSSGHDTSREGPASDIEASVSQISAEQTFYMQQRGLSKGESMSVSSVEIKPATNGRNDPASGFGVRHFEKIGIFLSNKPDSKELRRVCFEEKCRLTPIMVAGSFRPLLPV